VRNDRTMNGMDRLAVALIASTRALEKAQQGGNIGAAKERLLEDAKKLAAELQATAPPELPEWIAQVERERAGT
jgi:hypothetical protein